MPRKHFYEVTLLFKDPQTTGTVFTVKLIHELSRGRLTLLIIMTTQPLPGSVLVGGVLSVASSHHLLLGCNFSSTSHGRVQFGWILQCLVDGAFLAEDDDRVRVGVGL